LPTPPVDRTISALRSRVKLWRSGGIKIALVPTMGALHAGHLALVGEARKRAGRVLASIFVNPKQFAPADDFDTYPRDEVVDLAKLGESGVDAVFVPTAAEMYPEGFATSITVGGPTRDLETISRPQFFSGVATVVAKLFQIATPDFAVFGEKDYQQLLVIRRMAADLAFPIEIVAGPTVRENDGLALSSRNAYLTPPEREKAPRLYKALHDAATSIRGGMSGDTAIALAEGELTGFGFLVDYVALRNAVTLARVADQKKEPMRLLAAVWLGKTRLIDNVAV
jgi:pantoate--beta-alanine ligase